MLFQFQKTKTMEIAINKSTLKVGVNKNIRCQVIGLFGFGNVGQGLYHVLQGVP